LVQKKLIDDNFEKLIYLKLYKFKDCIEKQSLNFSVDKKLISSLLYVEHIQYDLSRIRKTYREIKDFVIKLNNENINSIVDKFNLSQGFTHIKPDTARYVLRKKKISREDVLSYKDEPEISIKLTCSIIRLHIDQWKSEIDLTNDIPILATLYNISNFRNKLPHKNPRVGGSELGVIIDGEYIEKMCFGARVSKVYDSKSMNLFWNGK
jgi:hypothetical protein